MKAFIQKAFGILINRAGEGPWRSKSVLTALAAVVVGLGFWCSDLANGPPRNETNNVVTNAPGIASPSQAVAPAGAHWNWRKPFPFYVRIGASYVAGFCIGWFFRRLIRMILAFTVLVVALLALGRFAGCDTTRTREQVERGGAWAQHEVTAAKDYLLNWLPSATAGGAGTFLGFRRRGKVAVPGSGTEINPQPR